MVGWMRIVMCFLLAWKQCLLGLSLPRLCPVWTCLGWRVMTWSEC